MVDPTLPSPLQYRYRTKLTPHFNPPREDAEVAIGFEQKGRRHVLDIEVRRRTTIRLTGQECPIATDIVQAGLTRERARVRSTIKTFKRGATLLLRHALPTRADGKGDEPYCETDHKRDIRERVAGFESVGVSEPS